MNFKPIIFSAPMVRALLDGSKTQTRRIVKGEALQWLVRDKFTPGFVAVTGNRLCPYGQPGDQLWVRETHWMDKRDTTLAVMNVDGFVVAMNGSETGQESNPEELGLNHFWKLRPSIHMPRWASRITLEITGVRVERLQDISEKDCWAEGIEQVMHDFSDEELCVMAKRIGCSIEDAKPIYALLWESINGPCSWAANPWVWVVEFNVKGAK